MSRNFFSDFGVGHWIVRMAAWKLDLAHQRPAIVQRQRQSIRDAVCDNASFNSGVAVDLNLGLTSSSNTRSVNRLCLELGVGDLAVHERDGRAVRQAMVGRFARFGMPFLRIFADDVHGRVESVNIRGSRLT